MVINEVAAKHLAGGVLADQDVDVGLHRLDDVVITINCPRGTAVEREAGDLGEGFESCEPTMPVRAALLFLDRVGMNVPASPELERWRQSVWKECFRDALKANGKVILPTSAAKALKELFAEMPELKPRRRTSAVRIGMNKVTVEVKQRKPAKRARKRRRPAMARAA